MILKVIDSLDIVVFSVAHIEYSLHSNALDIQDTSGDWCKVEFESTSDLEDCVNSLCDRKFATVHASVSWD